MKRSNAFYQMSAVCLSAMLLSSCGGYDEAASEEASAVLTANSASVFEGDMVQLDATGSVYDSMFWEMQGEEIAICAGAELCEIQMNTAGVFEIIVNAVGETTSQASVVIEVVASTQSTSTLTNAPVASVRSTASAPASTPSKTGFNTFIEFHKDGVNSVDGLNGVKGVSISPDNKHVYTTSHTDDALAVFSRNTSTGALTFVEFHKDGVNSVDGLNYAHNSAVSPDGKHVYVTGGADDAVAVFSRDADTGMLTYESVAKNGVGGVSGIDGAYDVDVSPDNNHVYVSSYWSDSVTVFSRDTSTGALTFVETHTDGAGGVDGMNAGVEVMVSPDGNHVYALGSDDNAIAVFSRNTGDGSLTFDEFHQDGSNGVDGMSSPKALVVSYDNKHVYVVGSGNDTVAIFSRNTSTGALTYVDKVQDGTGGADGMGGAFGLTISPDDKHIYVTGDTEDTMAVFSRNASTGALTFVEFHKDGVNSVDGIDGARDVVVSPDNNHIYIVGDVDDAIAVFSRD